MQTDCRCPCHIEGFEFPKDAIPCMPYCTCREPIAIGACIHNIPVNLACNGCDNKTDKDDKQEIKVWDVLNNLSHRLFILEDKLPNQVYFQSSLRKAIKQIDDHEKVINKISLDMKQSHPIKQIDINIKPYKCPVCLGTGLTSLVKLNDYHDPETAVEHCFPCSGKGIVWG